MKKGFTLVELLAVIIILAIVLLVVMPVVLKVINDAKKSAFESNVRGLIRSAENSYLKSVVIDNTSEVTTYLFLNWVQTSDPVGNKLQFSGRGPKEGYIKVYEDGDIELKLTDGTWYIKKEKENQEIDEVVMYDGQSLSLFACISWQVPIGAEAYNKEGIKTVSYEEESEICYESGMIVFKAAKDYGQVSTSGGEFEVLVVAGGGGGGVSNVSNNYGGGAGGGAGGLFYNNLYELEETTIAIIVGDGGQGRSNAFGDGNGLNGGNSTFSESVAIGGGGGGGSSNGNNGGSGGGGAGRNNAKTNGGFGTIGPPRQGYDGGDGFFSEGMYSSGGGGGGAGGIGATGTYWNIGGEGLLYFSFPYANGGDGCSGVPNNDPKGGNHGASNTGNGGQGAEYKNGGNGGSGIIIVRWGGYNLDYVPNDYLAGLGQSIYVPVGAEGYNKNGNLVIPYYASGFLQDEKGQVVFKQSRDYGQVSTSGGEFEVLVVAGGGGGGVSNVSNNYGGGAGGGAGGLFYNNLYELEETTIAIIVGDGGQGRSNAFGDGNGLNGGNSTFSESVAIGGGGGGGSSNGNNGGSGGGGAGRNNGKTNGGFGTIGPPRQGYDGGDGFFSEGMYSSGGGGGGAGGIGATGTYWNIGGEGLLYFSFPYANGGDGCSGVPSNDPKGGNHGASNTGNGGQGAEYKNGGNGGSGIIIVRWGGYSFNYTP